ncbi:MAG: hypothetical protein IKM20_09745 [Erysipelotrichales bacterium]|nr:hypothetical protein [Erysipelotrichales bacterium]
MKIKELYSLLQGQEGINLELREDVDYSYVFAGDLMSDVLAKVNDSGSKMILLTGLANAQSLRTAEMLDISVVVLVRGKTFREEDLEVAKEANITCFTTDMLMFEACGVLYSNGLNGVPDDIN